MKLKRLLSVLDVCECTADPELDIRDISFDSRTTQPGDLFAAVCGYESDGHRFIGAAAERGVAVVLCQRKPEVEIPYILVADSRLALSRICCEFFDNPSRELTMIGVTGTNGKTTTTYLLKQLLERCLGAKVGLIGTNQNMIGDAVLSAERTTPDALTLQRLLREMAEADAKMIEKYKEAIKKEDQVSESEYERRLTVCKTCELLNAGTCGACGCYVELRAAAAVSKCPYKKW